MPETYTVKLGTIIDEFSLETLYLPENGRDVQVSRCDINRSGLALAGFLDFFEPARIQIIGRAEHYYIMPVSYTHLRAHET